MLLRLSEFGGGGPQFSAKSAREEGVGREAGWLAGRLEGWQGLHINGAYPYVMYMPLNAAYVMLLQLHTHSHPGIHPTAKREFLPESIG